MKHVLMLLTVLTCFLSAGTALAQQKCSQVYVIAELDKKIHDLATLKILYDRSKTESLSLAEMATARYYPVRAQEFMSATGMSRESLLEKLRHETLKRQWRFEELQQEEGQRRGEQEKRLEIESRRTPEYLGSHMVFYDIEPGSFKMGDVGSQVDVILTQPFAMMATLVTQTMWRKIAEAAGARYGRKYNLFINPSKFRGDYHPVEWVSRADVGEWINGLNELSLNGDSILSELIPDHQKGDEYRLPTEAEWEFVVRGRGQYNDVYHFGNDESQLGDHAWHYMNSKTEEFPRGSTHPVALKKPLVIDDNVFFDMYGNVSQWMKDAWDGSSPLKGGVDPIGLSGPYHVTRGGNWSDEGTSLGSSVRQAHTEKRINSIGFRLVRIRP